MKTEINDIKLVLKSFVPYLFQIVFKFLTSCNLSIYKVYAHCLLHKFKKRQCHKLIFQCCT